LNFAPTATKTNVAPKKKATTIPKAKKATTSSTRSNSIASRPQGLPKSCSHANVALHSAVHVAEVEAQSYQYATHADFQSLLDSETTTEDDGLDLFDEAPRYIYANNF
jgi:hypothetical protein